MIFIRSAGERDLAAVRALLVETWHHTYDAIYGKEKVAAITDDWHSLAALKARLSRPRSEFVLADDGKAIAGMAFASADETGRVVTLHQIYVLPARQGAGVGGMLMDEIAECFPEAATMRLEVEPENRRAIDFYLSQGFAEMGRVENCGEERSGIPALVLERALL